MCFYYFTFLYCHRADIVYWVSMQCPCDLANFNKYNYRFLKRFGGKLTFLFVLNFKFYVILVYQNHWVHFEMKALVVPVQLYRFPRFGDTEH